MCGVLFYSIDFRRYINKKHKQTSQPIRKKRCDWKIIIYTTEWKYYIEKKIVVCCTVVSFQLLALLTVTVTVTIQTDRYQCSNDSCLEKLEVTKFQFSVIKWQIVILTVLTLTDFTSIVFKRNMLNLTVFK